MINGIDIKNLDNYSYVIVQFFSWTHTCTQFRSALILMDKLYNCKTWLDTTAPDSRQHLFNVPLMLYGY